MRSACELTVEERPGITSLTFTTARPPLRAWLAISAQALASGLLLVACCRALLPHAWSFQAQVAAGIVVAAGTAWLLARSSVQSESLVVHERLGLVLQRRTLLDSERTAQSVFVAEDQVEGVIINEVLSTTAVHSYLTLLLKGQEDLLVAFQALEPRLSQLVPVYKALLALGIGTA